MNIILALLVNRVMRNQETKKRMDSTLIHNDKIEFCQVQEEHWVGETPNYKYDLHIPVILGVENEALSRRINSDIKEAANQFLNELKSVANEYIILNVPYTLEGSYVIYQNNQDIVSVCLTFSNYYGGAHGMTYKKCYNYDVKKGKRIELKDLFKVEDYKDSIDKVIKAEIKKRNQAMGYEVINAFKGIRENQNFYIQEGRLTIYFDLYEIAPYVAGIIEFTMPQEIFSI